MGSPDVDIEEEKFQTGRLVAAHFGDERAAGREDHLLLRVLSRLNGNVDHQFVSLSSIKNQVGHSIQTYFSQDESFGRDAQDEGILTKGELAGTFRTLPSQVLLHQINVIQRGVVKVRVRDERTRGRVITRIWFWFQGRKKKRLREMKDFP